LAEYNLLAMPVVLLIIFLAAAKPFLSNGGGTAGIEPSITWIFRRLRFCASFKILHCKMQAINPQTKADGAD
jgi:hypothetical protein